MAYTRFAIVDGNGAAINSRQQSDTPMTRKIKVSNTSHAAAAIVKAAAKAVKASSKKTSKTLAKTAKAGKTGKASVLTSRGIATPMQGAQADFRIKVVKAFRKVCGKGKALSALSADIGKLYTAGCPNVRKYIGNSFNLKGDMLSFTDKGVTKYAPYDKA